MRFLLSKASLIFFATVLMLGGPRTILILIAASVVTIVAGVVSQLLFKVNIHETGG